jgi:hypothetical protein
VTGPRAQQAVVDRVVDGIAVLLVGAGEREVALPAERLPAGVGAGDVVSVRVDGPDVAILRGDQPATERRSAEVAARLQRIREERSGRRFGP